MKEKRISWSNEELKCKLKDFFKNIQRENYQYYPISLVTDGGCSNERFRIITNGSLDADAELWKSPDSKTTSLILDFEELGLDETEFLKAGKNALKVWLFGTHYADRKSKKIRYDLQSMVSHTFLATGIDLVSIRVNELLCVMEHIKKCCPNMSFEIHATGGGCLVALIAGLFESNIKAFYLDGLLKSFDEIIEKRNVFINDTDVIADFSKCFDVKDLLKSNADRKIELRGVTDAYGKRISPQEVRCFWPQENEK